MKRIILIPVIALMMLGCKKTDDQALTAEEKSAITIQVLEDKLEKQKMEIAKQTAIDSMQMINELKLPMAIAAAPAPVRTKVVYVKQRPAAQAPVQVPAPAAEAPQSESPTVADAPVMEDNAPVATVPEKKKGWSNTAKGAVIGAGAGAIGGAVIGKKDRVKGAVIGGVIGAIAGAGTGAILDHKKKKAAELQY